MTRRFGGERKPEPGPAAHASTERERAGRAHWHPYGHPLAPYGFSPGTPPGGPYGHPPRAYGRPAARGSAE